MRLAVHLLGQELFAVEIGRGLPVADLDDEGQDDEGQDDEGQDDDESDPKPSDDFGFRSPTSESGSS